MIGINRVLEILTQRRNIGAMTDLPTEAEKRKKDREERLAKNLRDNLRRRKAATRKASDNSVTDAPESP